MERTLNEQLLNDGVEIVSVGYEKKTSMAKVILVGASVIGTGWLAACLYKKFKKIKSKETDIESVEGLE